MLIQEVTSKFYLFADDNNNFIVTTRGKKQITVFQGTEEGAKEFINKHPYGVKFNEI